MPSINLRFYNWLFRPVLQFNEINYSLTILHGIKVHAPDSCILMINATLHEIKKVAPAAWVIIERHIKHIRYYTHSYKYGFIIHSIILRHPQQCAVHMEPVTLSHKTNLVLHLCVNAILSDSYAEKPFWALRPPKSLLEKAVECATAVKILLGY